MVSSQSLSKKKLNFKNNLFNTPPSSLLKIRNKKKYYHWLWLYKKRIREQRYCSFPIKMFEGARFFTGLVKIFSSTSGNLKESFNNILSTLLILKKNSKKKKLALLLSKIFFKINPQFYFLKYNIGRKVHFSPAPLFFHKKSLVASRWIKHSLNSRFGHKFSQKLFLELKDFFSKKGALWQTKKSNLRLALESKPNINRRKPQKMDRSRKRQLINRKFQKRRR